MSASKKRILIQKSEYCICVLIKCNSSMGPNNTLCDCEPFIGMYTGNNGIFPRTKTVIQLTGNDSMMLHFVNINNIMKICSLRELDDYGVICLDYNDQTHGKICVFQPMNKPFKIILGGTHKEYVIW